MKKQDYVAPHSETIELIPCGILCTSFGMEDWEKDDTDNGGQAI